MEIFKLVKVRSNQLKQQLSTLGFIYVLLLALLFGGFNLLLYNQINSDKLAWIFVFVVFIGLLQFHISRKDAWFVQAHIINPKLNMYAEYFLLALPVFLVILIKAFYLPALAIPILIGFIVYIEQGNKQLKLNYRLLNVVPSKMYEWCAGLKKVYYPFLILILLSVALSGYRIVSLFIVWILSTIVSGFYNENESLQILFANGKTAKEIIHAKIKDAWIIFFLIVSPALMLNLTFHFFDWWLIVLLVLSQSIFLVFIICLKYATYIPGKSFGANGVLLSISQLAVIIPFLLPVPLFLGVRFYRRAINNLNQYV